MKQLLLFPLLFFCILMAGCEKDKDTFSAVYDVANYVDPLIDNDVITVVCDNSEFRQTFGDDADVLEPIDFSRNKLLVVRGTSNYGIDKIEKSLTVSELNVAIKQNISAVVENWCVAYVVPISFDITNVRLVINYK